MRKWFRILPLLLAADALLLAFAHPLMLLLDGDSETARWGALALRFYGGCAAAILLVALVVAWNLRSNLPPE